VSYRRSRRGRYPEDSASSLESYLSNIGADKLKQIARVWVGKDAYKMNKEACLVAVRKALEDPRSVREMVSGLSDFERAGLGLIKLRGENRAGGEELAAELLMLGYEFKGKTNKYAFYYDSNHYVAINALLDRGLIVRLDGSKGHFDRYSHGTGISSDGRILAEIEPLSPKPLDIKPAEDVKPDYVRHPSEVLLDLVAFGQAIERIGGVDVSAKGLVAKPSIAKLRKALGWNDALDEKSPTPLPESVAFYLMLWDAAGLLNFDPYKRLLTVVKSYLSFLERPFDEQSELWVKAYRSISHWLEYVPRELSLSFYDFDEDQNKYNGLRSALLLALAALPDARSWYGIDELSDAIFARMGEYFSIGYRHDFYRPYNKSPEEIKAAVDRWQAEQHAAWRKQEQNWIRGAIVGPLYHLGLVELASVGGKKSEFKGLFRLSMAGRASIWDKFRSQAKSAVSSPRACDEKCWVIQPNFDLIVYMDTATPKQLSFIERIGERQRVDGVTAIYRLTREAIYKALESGLEAERVIQTLEKGSRHKVPENIIRSLNDWAKRRERIAVHLDAHIMEFGSLKARDAAIEAGKIKGTAIGDRFLLVAGMPGSFDTRGIISYKPTLTKCLSVSEKGMIKIDPLKRDLLIAGELASFCEPVPRDNYSWRISRASVHSAIKRGWMAEGILNNLTQRTSHALPPLLVKAMHAWSGSGSRTPPGPLALPAVMILQVTDQDVADAIAVSSLLNPFFESRLGPKAFLVKKVSVARLTEILTDYGFVVGKNLLLGNADRKKTK
jgi:hypothetical protein